MRMEKRLITSRLGWLAHLQHATNRLVVYHGAQVEHGDDWLVEGIWDGNFSGIAFDGTDCFFGSGLIQRGEVLIAVASRATVDRLLYASDGSDVWVSNSLVLLLAATGARLNPSHSYRHEMSGAVAGLEKYKRSLPVLHPRMSDVFQLYHGNLIVSREGLRTELPAVSGAFADFTSYREFLSEKIEALCSNLRSKERAFPLECFSTLSTGYDSPAVNVLVKDVAKLRHCLTTADGEDGRPLARHLGIDPLVLDRTAGSVGNDELYFLAATFHDFETLFHSIAGHIATNPAVLFTGYHGGKVWIRDLPDHYINDQLICRDMSGSGLAEFRLRSGFINAAIPFIGARRVESIRRISEGDDMRPWSVGGNYDRPIPRRICEQAGLPRNAFGMRKTAATLHYERPRNPALREQFTRALPDFRIGPVRLALYEAVNQIAWHLGWMGNQKRALIHNKPTLRFYLFIWAAHLLADRYSAEFAAG